MPPKLKLDRTLYDKAIKEVDNYFGSKSDEKDYKNNYTDILKGKNVIAEAAAEWRTSVFISIRKPTES